MIRRAVSRRVIPLPGWTAFIVTCIGNRRSGSAVGGYSWISQDPQIRTSWCINSKIFQVEPVNLAATSGPAAVKISSILLKRFCHVRSDFRNVEILLVHDESGGVRALNLMNFVRWREFHCFSEQHEAFHVTRRVVTPKSNTGRGQTSRRRPPDPTILLVCSRSDCSRMKP